MGIQSKTTWSADAYRDDTHSSVELERSDSAPRYAELVINYNAKVYLDSAALRELSKAAALIAEELET